MKNLLISILALLPFAVFAPPVDPVPLPATAAEVAAGVSRTKYVSPATLVASAVNGVSVKSSPYLAKGDGITDDTAAIQACFTANTRVHIPDGTFLVGELFFTHDGGEITASPGAILKLKASVTTGTLLNLTGKSITVSGLTLDGGPGTFYQPRTYSRGTRGTRTGVGFRGEGAGRLDNVVVWNFSEIGIFVYGDTDADARLNKAQIFNPTITNCWTGLWMTNNNGSEYISVLEPKISFCNTLVELDSANIEFSGFTLREGNIGIFTDPGNRRAHYNIIGGMIHHTGYPFYIRNADYAKIMGCSVLAGGATIITNSTGVAIKDNFFQVTIGTWEWCNSGQTNVWTDNIFTADSGQTYAGNWELVGFLQTNSYWCGNYRIGSGLVLPYGHTAGGTTEVPINVHPQTSLGNGDILSTAANSRLFGNLQLDGMLRFGVDSLYITPYSEGPDSGIAVVGEGSSTNAYFPYDDGKPVRFPNGILFSGSESPTVPRIKTTGKSINVRTGDDLEDGSITASDITASGTISATSVSGTNAIFDHIYGNFSTATNSAGNTPLFNGSAGNGAGLTNLSSTSLPSNTLRSGYTNLTGSTTSDIALRIDSAAGRPLMFIDGTGRVAFGKNDPSTMTEQFEMTRTLTGTPTENMYGLRSTFSLSADESPYGFASMLGEMYVPAGNTNNYNLVRGNYGYVKHSGTGILTNQMASYNICSSLLGGRTLEATLFYGGYDLYSTSRVDDLAVFRVRDVYLLGDNRAGTFSGVKIPALVGGTNTYGIWSESASNRFDGRIQLAAGVGNASALGFGNGSYLYPYTTSGARLDASTGFFVSDGSTLTFAVTNNMVGIMTTTPLAKLHVEGPNVVTHSKGHVFVASSSAYAIDRGGQISLGGPYNTAGGMWQFGGIAGRKEDGTDGSAAGYLALSSAGGGGSLTEGIRLNSSQNVGIGTTNPTNKLQVMGSIESSGTVYGNAGSFTNNLTVGGMATASTLNTATPAFKSLGTNNIILRCPDGGSFILRIDNAGTISTTTNSSNL